MANDALPPAPPAPTFNFGSSSADSTNANLRNQQLSELATAFEGLAAAIEASLIGGQTGVTPDIILVSKGTSGRALQPSGVTIASLGSLTNMATDRVLGRDTAGAGPVEELTLSQVLDFIGSPAHGDILYRDTSVWARLPAGTSGQFLQTLGAGADPQWAVAGAATVPQGRVTLATNTPVMTSTTSAQTTVRYTPYFGRFVPLYNGSTFVMTDTGGELTQTTSDTTKSPAAVAANSNYDVFVWSDSGTIRATRGPAWTNDTTRSSTLTRVQGFPLNTSSITNGPAAERGTYVGTIRSNGSSQIDWIYGTLAAGGGASTLGVWNMYNRVDVSSLVGDSTNSWTYGTDTWRSSNNSTSNRVSFVIGLAEDQITGSFFGPATGTAGGGGTGGSGSSIPDIAIGLDSTSSPTSNQSFGTVGLVTVRALATISPQVGFHFIQALEISSGSSTFYGDNNAPTKLQHGLHLIGRF